MDKAEPEGSGLLGFSPSFAAALLHGHGTEQVASANSLSSGGESFALYHQISQKLYCQD